MYCSDPKAGGKETLQGWEDKVTLPVTDEKDYSFPLTMSCSLRFTGVCGIYWKTSYATVKFFVSLYFDVRNKINRWWKWKKGRKKRNIITGKTECLLKD